jgi:hypothetical protein
MGFSCKACRRKAHILQMGLQGNDMLRWIYRKIQGRTSSSRIFRMEQYGLDYDETFSLVAKLTTVRVVLALAANRS